ncbi:hypothetical protein J6590_058980 [Homalodisca vitripennis]|nr:hypothetical protein J6590_058980 [Homalodisca vitripennis]
MFESVEGLTRRCSITAVINNGTNFPLTSGRCEETRAPYDDHSGVRDILGNIAAAVDPGRVPDRGTKTLSQSGMARVRLRLLFGLTAVFLSGVLCDRHFQGEQRPFMFLH